VDAVAEGEVTRGVPGQVQPVGVGDPVRIAVSRADRRENLLARRDHHDRPAPRQAGAAVRAGVPGDLRLDEC
jgi:hypothetical protein